MSKAEAQADLRWHG